MALFQAPNFVNGVAASWADAALRVTGVTLPLLELPDIASLEFESSVERGSQMQGGRPIAFTRGVVSYSASLGLYLSGYDKLMGSVVTSAPTLRGKRVAGRIAFDLDFSYSPPDVVSIFQWRLKGCQIDGHSLSGAEGSDAQQITVPMSVLEIVYVKDGVEIVPV